MKYSQWRSYGHISRLSTALQCKGPGGNINTANSISSQQLGVSSAAGKRASDDYASFKTLLQPFVSKETALASGDRSEALRAAMPVISQLSSGFNGAKQQLMNTMPAGAARDRALSDLTVQTAGTIGGAQAGMVNNASDSLSELAKFFGSMSLQDMGAQLSGLSGGATTNYNAGQLAAQQQASMLNFFGSLAGAAGGMVSPIKICWIAEAIYGADDFRTLLVRAYLNGPFRAFRVGRCVMATYGLIGRPVAWLTKRSRILRAVLQPLFDRALFAATLILRPSPAR